MRRAIVLLAAVATALLLASGVALGQAADTTLSKHPSLYDNTTNATFGFESNEAGATFECKLDGGAFDPCESPKKYSGLSEGSHTFQVQARDTAGNVDETPEVYAWEIDLTDPVITFTARPGRLVNSNDWVTNDRTPTWAWTVTDENLGEGGSTCELSKYPLDTTVVSREPCASPKTWPSELTDGFYYFEVLHYDKAHNGGYEWQYFEVDTVAPKIVSAKPTGRSVPIRPDVVVTFDDHVFNSTRFVNIYRRGSNTPLAVFRSAYGKTIEISPKNNLTRDTWYTVEVTTGVNDGANRLGTSKTWSFKTRG